MSLGSLVPPGPLHPHLPWRGCPPDPQRAPRPPTQNTAVLHLHRLWQSVLGRLALQPSHLTVPGSTSCLRGRRGWGMEGDSGPKNGNRYHAHFQSEQEQMKLFLKTALQPWSGLSIDISIKLRILNQLVTFGDVFFFMFLDCFRSSICLISHGLPTLSYLDIFYFWNKISWCFFMIKTRMIVFGVVNLALQIWYFYIISECSSHLGNPSLMYMLQAAL